MVQLIAALGLAAFQVASGYQQGEMMRENARFKKEIDDLNIESAQVDAFNAEKEGWTQQARYKNVIDSTVSEQRSDFAAKGVDVNYGSAAELQDESKLTGYLNLIDIQKKANERAQGFRREAANTFLSSSLSFRQSESEASAKQMSGLMTGAGTAISGYSRS